MLGRHSLALREEVEHFNESQEVLAVLMEGKMNMQKTAQENFQRQIFQELKELEEQKTREATKAQVGKMGCKGWSRQGQSGAHDNSSFGSCSSFQAFDTDEALSASSKVAKDADQALSEASWTALTKPKLSNDKFLRVLLWQKLKLW